MLRTLEQKDIPLILEWMHDDKVNRIYQRNFKDWTSEDVKKYIDNSYNERIHCYAFVDENDDYLGTVSLKDIDYSNKNAEYAIVTRSVAQGTGVAYHATLDVLRVAFCELNLHRVYLEVLSDNIKAKKLYEKCGFKYEGKLKDHFYIGNMFRDMDIYGIIREDYLEMMNG